MRLKHVLAALPFVLTLGLIRAEAQTTEMELVIDRPYISIGEERVPCVAPYIVNDSTLVPLRTIAEIFRLEVDWSPSDRGVSLNSVQNAIRLVIDRPSALVNGYEMPLLAAPEIRAARTMVPLRFVSEQLGARVEYVESQRKIFVTWHHPVPHMRQNDLYEVMAYSDQQRIGDSFYGWSMKKPTPFRLVDMDFSGRSRFFRAYHGDARLQISVAPTTDIESDLALDVGMDVLAQYEPSKNRYGQDVYSYIHRGNNDELLWALVAGVTDNAIVSVSMNFEDGIPPQRQNEYLDIFESFDTQFAEDCADVTHMTDGGVLFVNQDANYTIVAPPLIEQMFIEDELPSPDKVSFSFVDPDQDEPILAASISVFENDGMFESAEQFFQDRLDYYKFTYNPAYLKGLVAKNIVFAGVAACEITFALEQDGQLWQCRDILLMVDKYCYSLYSVLEQGSPAEKQTALSQFFGTFSPYEISGNGFDQPAFIKSMRTDNYYDWYFSLDLDLPYCTSVEEGYNGLIITADTSTFEIVCEDTIDEPAQELSYVEEEFLRLANDYGGKDLQSDSFTINGYTCLSQGFNYTFEDVTYHIYQYSFASTDTLYIIRLTAEDMYNTHQKRELAISMAEMILQPYGYAE